MKQFMLFTALLGLALPSEAAIIFTMDPTVGTPTVVGTYTGGTTVAITASGTVNLNGPAGLIITNPDGSLWAIPSAVCTTCWAPGYQFFIPGANSYPTFAGGDGNNYFPGGGGNYDMFPGSHSAWASEGKRSTDTADPLVIRFGTLAYTFAVNPSPTDWLPIGYGGLLLTPSGGATLQMVVVDTFYTNNTGGYTVSVDPVPEPAAIWLAFSGFAILGLPRAFRRLSRKG